MLFWQRREHEAGNAPLQSLQVGGKMQAIPHNKTWTRQIRGLPRSPAEFIK